MPIGPHIYQWLDERKIAVPEGGGDLYGVLRDGRVFLQILHAHIDNKPDFPKTRLDRWKLIASILLDAGVELSDYGLRMALLSDHKTLDDVMHAIYALYNPGEGVALPVNLEPEPEMQYPLMYNVVVDRATCTKDFRDRIHKLISLEHPDASREETNLLVLEEMSQRMEQVKHFDLKDDFLVLIFDQLKKTGSDDSIRAAAILKNFLKIIGPEATYEAFVTSTHPRLVMIQRELVRILRSQSTPPELLDFLHQFILTLSIPDKLQIIFEKLFFPHMTVCEVLEECSRLVEIAGGGKKVIRLFTPWMLKLTGDIITGGDGTTTATFVSDNPILKRPSLPFESLDDDTGGFAEEEPEEVEEPPEEEKKEEGEQEEGEKKEKEGEEGKTEGEEANKEKEPIEEPKELTEEEKYLAEVERKEAEKAEEKRKEKARADLLREAVLLSLRLWTDYPDLYESLGEMKRMKEFLKGSTGLSLMGQQAVLSELSAVVFVCADIYDMMLGALRTMFNRTHQRRILLRSLLDLHLGNPAISIAPLLGLVGEKLVGVQCGVAEGEALVMFAQHAGINGKFTTLTSDLITLARNLVNAEPFLHTHACAVVLMLGQTLAQDPDYIAALQNFVKGIFQDSEFHPHAPLLFHCVTKVFHNSSHVAQEAIISSAHLFVQILIRQIERNEKDRIQQEKLDEETRVREEEEKRIKEEAAKMSGVAQQEVDEDDPLVIAERQAEQRIRDTERRKKEAERVERERHAVWEEGVKRCVAELGIGFIKVPMADLDPPETPKEATPKSLSPGLSPVAEGLVDEFQNAEDIFNQSEGAESGMLHARTFDTASETSSVIMSQSKRRVGKQSKDALARMAFQNMAAWMKKDFVMPIVKDALDMCAKRAFSRRVREKGFLNPHRKIHYTAKEAHEQRLQEERELREQQMRDQSGLRDLKRLERDKILKSMLSAAAKREERDKTPSSKGFYARALTECSDQQTEWREFILREEQKTFINIYRESREHYRQMQALEAQHQKIEDMKQRQVEQARRELLRTKLDEYFDVKEQQEESRRREEWERQMQEEFDERLQQAKRSDRQKREVLLWKMDKERRRQEEEAARLREEEDAEEEEAHRPPASSVSPSLRTKTKPKTQQASSASAQGRHRLPPLATGSASAERSGPSTERDQPPPSHRSTAGKQTPAGTPHSYRSSGKVTPTSQRADSKRSTKQSPRRTPQGTPLTPAQKNSRGATPLASPTTADEQKPQTPAQQSDRGATPAGSTTADEEKPQTPAQQSDRGATPAGSTTADEEKPQTPSQQSDRGTTPPASTTADEEKPQTPAQQSDRGTTPPASTTADEEKPQTPAQQSDRGTTPPASTTADEEKPQTPAQQSDRGATPPASTTADEEKPQTPAQQSDRGTTPAGSTTADEEKPQTPA